MISLIQDHTWTVIFLYQNLRRLLHLLSLKPSSRNLCFLFGAFFGNYVLAWKNTLTSVRNASCDAECYYCHSVFVCSSCTIQKTSKAWYKYTYSKDIAKRLERKGPGKYKSIFEERNTARKNKKGVTGKRQLIMYLRWREAYRCFWRVIIVLPFVVWDKTTSIYIFHGHILILYYFFLKRQWFLFERYKMFFHTRACSAVR